MWRADEYRYIGGMTDSPSSHLIGYARVSTADQAADLQTDALQAAGCTRLFVETASGVRTDRPALAKAIDHLREGDTLVVWKLDRLGRSLRHLVEIVNRLDELGVGFRSIHELIDTTTTGGRLTFHLFASLAEFERDLIAERTSAGLSAARARGRVGGRPTVMTPRKTQVARELLDAVDEAGRRKHTVASVAETLSVSRASIYRALERTAASGTT